MYISCTEGRGILLVRCVYEFLSNSEFVKMELLYVSEKNKYPLVDIKVSILNNSTWKIDSTIFSHAVKILSFLTPRDNNDEF